MSEAARKVLKIATHHESDIGDHREQKRPKATCFESDHCKDLAEKLITICEKSIIDDAVITTFFPGSWGRIREMSGHANLYKSQKHKRCTFN